MYVTYFLFFVKTRSICNAYRLISVVVVVVCCCFSNYLNSESIWISNCQKPEPVSCRIVYKATRV